MQLLTSRRNTELSLLILALILGAGALALVAVAEDVENIDKTTPYMIGLSVGYIAAHLAVRRLAAQSDPLILPVIALLNGLGLAAVYRLDPDNLGPAQVTWTFVGLAFFVLTLVLLRDFKILARYKYMLGFLGVGLLLLPMSPIGATINGARLWVRIGSMSFQPGEIAKICLVIFFAAYLAERKELLAIASKRVAGIHLPDLKHFGPLLLMWGMSLAVMFYEKDLGSSLLFFSIFLLMIYIATAPFVYVGVGGLLFLTGAYFGYQAFSHVQTRVAVWLNVFDQRYITDEGYQLAESLFVLATGGLFGTGLNRGRPDLIPEAETDFIFAVIGEEMGLMGTVGVLLCFMVLVACGLRIAMQQRDDFGQLLAAGLIITFGIQTIIILGGVIRLLPLTGITLPFMSYGGSSLLSNFILMALLVRISHQTVSAPAPAHTAEILIGGSSLMQRQIRLVGIGVLVGFIAVFGMLNYVQFFEADAIAGNRANTRALLAEYSVKRGDIVTADQVTLARSEETDDRLKYLRHYPIGDLFGQVTGYYSHIYGTDGLERSFNDYLLGEAGEISMQEIKDNLFGDEKQGDNVILTVDSRMQQAARDALAGRRGAVVAIDPQSGEVLALWSHPSYDPDPLATHDAKQARQAWTSLSPRSPMSPLINLATLRRYPPGSTMKVVSAAAALESGATPETTYDDPQALDLPLTDETLQNFTRTACLGGGQIDLFTALEISCDTTFGMIGLQLHDEIREMAEAMGFNDTLDFDVRTVASIYPDIPDDSAPFRAFAAIGQGDTVATPIQMALVAATIANGGEVPRPRIVSEIVDRSAETVRQYGRETLGEAMSDETARQVAEMMVAVVESGTGTAAQIPDVSVAGKTGTAQTGREGESPHTWFISFAPAENPKIATAVIVENGGTAGSEATGGAVAAPVSKAVMEADRRLRGW